MRHKITNYEYFCHIHSKKEDNTEFGNISKDYLYQNLLGNSEIIKDIFDTFINT